VLESGYVPLDCRHERFPAAAARLLSAAPSLPFPLVFFNTTSSDQRNPNPTGSDLLHPFLCRVLASLAATVVCDSILCLSIGLTRQSCFLLLLSSADLVFRFSFSSFIVELLRSSSVFVLRSLFFFVGCSSCLGFRSTSFFVRRSVFFILRCFVLRSSLIRSSFFILLQSFFVLRSLSFVRRCSLFVFVLRSLSPFVLVFFVFLQSFVIPLRIFIRCSSFIVTFVVFVLRSSFLRPAFFVFVVHRFRSSLFILSVRGCSLVVVSSSFVVHCSLFVRLRGLFSVSCFMFYFLLRSLPRSSSSFYFVHLSILLRSSFFILRASLILLLSSVLAAAPRLQCSAR
jgi:hypothetical protein